MCFVNVGVYCISGRKPADFLFQLNVKLNGSVPDLNICKQARTQL